jgi:A/G-specific adenine glycosylase
MLQQTQVSTVVPYFERWMAALPTVGDLAACTESTVLRLWEGLGYYSRARNLRRAAQQVVTRHDGVIPDDRDAFGALAGVGPYTVAAVLSIAFDRPLAVVDGNVRRVIARLVALERDPRPAVVANAVQALAAALLEGRAPSRHNQAMMELGALICTPRGPACGRCPVRSACRAAASAEPERFPPRAARRPVPHQPLAVALLAHRGRLLIDRRPYGGLLAGMWDLPTVALDTRALEVDEMAGVLEAHLARQYGLTATVSTPLAPVDHAFTHLRVTLHPFRCRLKRASSRAATSRSWRWAPLGRLADYPMPRAARRVLAQL